MEAVLVAHQNLLRRGHDSKIGYIGTSLARSNHHYGLVDPKLALGLETGRVDDFKDMV